MYLFINSSTDPAYNLALEEVLASECPVPLFMLWRNGPAIIVGRNQNTFAEINSDFIREHNIPVVRRITGGGAVYHDLGNWNYTLAVEAQLLDANAFADCAQPIVKVLRSLGAFAEFSGRNDILVGGKKVSGSAKNVLKNRTLFHGTLLFSTDLSILSEALRPDTAKIQAKGIKSVRSRVANLQEFLPQFDTESFGKTLEKKLLEYYGLTASSPLPEPLLKKAEILADKKYRTWNWNYGSATPYSWCKRGRFSGGSVEIACNIKNNQITELKISGDFFGMAPVEELENEFIGINPGLEPLQKKIKQISLQKYIQGVSEIEFLSLFPTTGE